MAATPKRRVGADTSRRRVGADTSQTRDLLLDSVEKMVLEKGYASVTYRALAAHAGVTPSLVQYYFPTLDDIFLAAISRYSDRNIAILEKVLASRADDPLRALWEYSWDEATTALTTEFMALGNHRESVRAHIADVTRQMKKAQFAALTARYGADARPGGDLPLGALMLLITGIPKFLGLEEGLGVDTAHAELVDGFERYLDSIEPRPADARPRRRRRTR